jgi:hypothetical protein
MVLSVTNCNNYWLMELAKRLFLKKWLPNMLMLLPILFASKAQRREWYLIIIVTITTIKILYHWRLPRFLAVYSAK